MLWTFRFLQVGPFPSSPFWQGQEGTDSEQAPDVVSLSEEPGPAEVECEALVPSQGPTRARM